MAMLDSGQVAPTAIGSTLGHSSLQMIVNHYAKSINRKAMDIDEAIVLY
jgi:hypothetical protein